MKLLRILMILVGISTFSGCTSVKYRNIHEALNLKHNCIFEKLTEEQRDELYPKLFIPINLNTAKREEILLVPRLGDKMAHEFEEYRPYTNIQQFRREIGKYVDEKEVARLERYIFIKK